jgi:hypothetical protein
MSVKSIQFKGTINGEGIVNYDSKSALPYISNLFPSERSIFYSGKKNENLKFAKHHFEVEKNAEGVDVAKRFVSISGDCLRHAIFAPFIPFQNQGIMYSNEALSAFIASKAGLLRGYLFPKKNASAIKKASSVTITDAVQTSSGVSTFQVGSTSGPKGKKDEEADSGAVSFYHSETIGNIEYKFEGAINLMELQFISLSETYDRMAAYGDTDFLPIYKRYFELQFGGKLPLPEPKWYLLKGSPILTPEKGILLTGEHCVELTKTLFQLLLGFSIYKSKAYARLKTLEGRMIENPIEDFEKSYKSVRSASGVIDLKPVTIAPEDVHIFYQEISEQDALAISNDIAKNKAVDHEEKVKAKEEKVAKRAAWMAKKEEDAKKKNGGK